MQEALDNYDRLIEYIKSNHFNPYKTRAIWSIILCYSKEVGDPYYKYSLYYTDNETDFLRLKKTKMVKYNSAYSTIKYLDFSIYPMDKNITTESFTNVKKILEEYTGIFLSNYAEKYSNIKGIQLLNDKIRIEYTDAYIFKCSIDIYNNI